MIFLNPLTIGAVYLCGVVAWALYCGLYSKVLSRRLHTFQHRKPVAHKKILVIGDSAVRGVGVSDVHDTLPALIEANSGDTEVRVCAVDGARCVEVLQALHTIRESAYKNCDQVVIFCGGMDIIKFTRRKKIQQDLQELFFQSKLISNNVVFISPPNVGNAPIFLPPLSYLYSYRSKIFFEISKDTAHEHGITFVDYFHTVNTHYAGDRSHPDRLGYHNLFNMFKMYLI